MGLSNTSETIKLLTVVVLETIDEADPIIGAPGGHLYLAMSSINIPLDTFIIFMGSLVRLGFLTHKGDCYHITQAGKDYIRKSKEAAETTRRQSDAVV